MIARAGDIDGEPAEGRRLDALLRAPAKVNLALLVGPPAADGYHPLLTVFMPVDLFDVMRFELRATQGSGADGGGGPVASLTVECPGVPREGNLITRALAAVGAATGFAFGGSVTVEKRIPTGAGLGGGSSNAACALRVGAELVRDAGGPVLEAETLRMLARGLGADVPFFLDPRPSIARGVGDELSPLELPDLPLVLVLPDEELSTAEVYRTFDGVAGNETDKGFEGRCRQAEQAWRMVEEAWKLGELTLASFCVQVASLMQNDLERASLHLTPSLALRLAAITRGGALAALMSGSGPSLFGLCASADEAERLAADLVREGMRARVTWAGGGVVAGA